MARYLLDTNHASPLVTFNHPLRQKVVERMVAGDEFFVTVVNLAEILAGIGSLPRAARNLEEWSRLEREIGILGFEANDARNAAQLQILLRTRGLQLATIDAQITVIALREDITLLTVDGDFEAITPLRTENWLSVSK